MCCCGCCSQPCIKTFFGLPLKRTVLAIGIFQLIITVIATIANVVALFALDQEGLKTACGEEWIKLQKDGEIQFCAGIIVKYAVFDAAFGVGCSLLLIFGSLSGNCCLLISWVTIMFCVSIKYFVQVVGGDWTSTEDWVAITYLIFYSVSFWIVVSFNCLTQSNRDTDTVPVIFTAVPTQQPTNPYWQPTIVVNTNFVGNPQQPQNAPQLQEKLPYPPQEQPHHIMPQNPPPYMP